MRELMVYEYNYSINEEWNTVNISATKKELKKELRRWAATARKQMQ